VPGLAAVLLELAPEELAAHHNVLCRVVQQVHGSVLALMECGRLLSPGIVLRCLTVSDRAAPFFIPVLVVVKEQSEYRQRLGTALGALRGQVDATVIEIVRDALSVCDLH
jgi:hypothetical protein